MGVEIKIKEEKEKIVLGPNQIQEIKKIKKKNPDQGKILKIEGNVETTIIIEIIGIKIETEIIIEIEDEILFINKNRL